MLKINRVAVNEWKLSGRFDASQTEKASAELSQLQESATLDLEELDYISSMGLSVLVNTYKRLNEKGHALRLSNPNSHVRDVFRYTRLDQVFQIIE